MRTVSSCPACGGHRTEVVASLDAERTPRFVEFDRRKYGGLLAGWVDSVPPIVLRCPSCGHCWYQHQPEPEQLGRMYAAGRPLAAGAKPTREPSQAMREEMRRLRRLANGTVGTVTLLDYGSGLGRWARAATTEGFRVTAFEPSMERGAEAEAPFELVHSIEDLGTRRFDAIQLEQVLEHVPDPLETLVRLRQHCSEQTVVRITVPNLLRDPDGQGVWASWPFDGQTPHVLAPFEHLHGFTPDSLDALTRRAGYRPITVGRLLRERPMLLTRRWLSAIVPKWGTTAQYLELAPLAQIAR